MEKGDKEYLIIDQAYQKFLEFERNESEKVISAKQCINDFNKAINEWDGEKDLDYIIESYLVGNLADAVAAPGSGIGNKKEFIRFMNDKETKEKIALLREVKTNNNLRIEGKINFKIIKQIQDIKLLQSLDKWESPVKKNKPIILVERFLCIMFSEIFTSIAKYAAAFEASKVIGFISRNTKESERPYYKYFEQTQSDLRDKIDTYFKLKGQNVENHISFSVAWFLNDI